MEVVGFLKEIYETKDVGANGFQMRECVVSTEEQYPQHILIQFTQDKCNLLTSFRIGEKVKLDINLRGREWVNPVSGETKYFNTIQAWRISSIQHPVAPAPAPAQTQTNPQQYGPAGNLNEEEADDLPF